MQNKKPSIKNPFLILFTLTLGIYLGKYLAVPNQYIQISNTDTGQLPKLVELLSYLEFNYVDSIDLDSLQEEVIASTLESLDPHSSYIPIEELQDITESMQGNFEGIGVQFQIIKDIMCYIKLNKNKILIILVLAFIFYLWAELGVGLFFQNSWGGQ